MDVNRTAWMSECPTCTTLADAVEAAIDVPHAEFIALETHLVDDHLARIPDYDEQCANCVEWRMSAGDPAGSLSAGQPAWVLPYLGFHDLRHRAGHLVRPLARS